VPGLTSYQADVLLAHAIIELSEGRTDGPGLAHARSLVALADAGVSSDPHGLRNPPPTPKAPNLADVITNKSIDGPAPATPRRHAPMPGTRAWFDARERKRQAAGK
jgi:hypothetical protein